MRRRSPYRGICAWAFGSILLLLLAEAACAQEYSELWGSAGEKWKPDGRLPDFSYAGYHCGEDPIPRIKTPLISVADFGAVGDGKTDCTQAFIKALDSVQEGVISIPAGRYLISDIIWIKKPSIVLRGEGPGKTIIYCTKELEDVKPNMGATTSGKPTSNYSWSGGFLWVKGGNRNQTIGKVVSDCKRGAAQLEIGQSQVQLRKGQRVALEMVDDSSKSLLMHMYSNDPGDTAKVTKPVKVTMLNRVVSANGTKLVLERPLRFDIRKSWSPRLQTLEPTVSEVGIEDLSIDFPVKRYPGHTFEERGMNGIAMNDVSDCWIRNVQISNSDSGIYLSGTFCTAEGIVLDSRRPQGKGTTGHHGISFGNDCLVRNFEFKTHFVHDFTVSSTQSGNVVKNGKGTNISLDHHKKAPCENLFCNIDVGKGSEIWRCGGGSSLGKHCGARGTFWCIRSEQNINQPGAAFGPDSINLVGLKTKAKTEKDPQGRWFETIPPEKLQPADLHAAQLQRRKEAEANR